MRKKVEQLIQQQLLEQQRKIEQANNTDGNPRRFLAKATAMYADGSHKLVLEFDSKSRNLKVIDLSSPVNPGNPGNVLFDGPINTEEQRKLVPQEVRAKLQTLEKSTRIEIRRLEPPSESKTKPTTPEAPKQPKKNNAAPAE